ncbi:MAG: GNAT family N-acetyltransferase [Scrofimicrobium sp.]
MTELTLKADASPVDSEPSVEGLQLATLTIYDLPALASLSLVAYKQRLTAENFWRATDEIRLYFEGALGTPRDDSFIGAWLDGELVGAVFCVLDAPFDDVPRGPFVLDLMVDPEHRRRGIATALVAELSQRTRDWGYDAVTLRLDMKQMPEAFNLYRRLGFAPIAEEVREQHRV